MRALDLFAGAGGMSLGLKWAGWDVQGVEVNADAVDTHNRYAGPCLHQDVTQFHPEGAYDLVAGGPPCQTFSSSGDRQGMRDPRGILFLHLLRVAKEANARVVLMENVRGMATLQTGQGTALGLILQAFQRHGYHTAHAPLNSADYGVPQFRERIFIVGFRDLEDRRNWRWPEPTHGPEGNLFGLPPWVSVRVALGLGSGHCISGRIEGASGYQGQRLIDIDKPSYTLGSNRNPDLISVLDEPSPTIMINSDHQGEGKRASQRKSTVLKKALHAHRNRLDEPSPTISCGGTRSGGAAPLANKKSREELLHQLFQAGLSERPATTITSRDSVAKAGHHVQHHDQAVRLSIRDCALLQGFPEDWVWSGNKGSQHEQVGNAVPPLMARTMGAQILKTLEMRR